MGKKRGVWWIVGGLAAVLAMFAAVAALHETSETQLEDELDAVLADYGFEHDYSHVKVYYSNKIDESHEAFAVGTLTKNIFGTVVQRLSDACQNCEIESDLSSERVVLRTPESYERVGDIILKRNVGPTPFSTGGGPRTQLTVYVKFHRPGVWQRIKGLWPW